MPYILDHITLMSVCASLSKVVYPKKRSPKVTRSLYSPDNQEFTLKYLMVPGLKILEIGLRLANKMRLDLKMFSPEILNLPIGC